ncbi:phage tail-collar fiber domain-containing protein [Escherichia coli]|uniref:Bcv gene product n=4 Tax=Enterobacteriaceae TaxID=543 RepID=A0A377HDF8_ECOLX|nr:phage tail protein [Escherichia coli]EGA6729229.1 phage tail protein [Shigella flexneri]EGA6737812.1 phage tail protein [Shigella flexneri]EGD4734865.1 phage tail protein [Shigella flexneri]EGD4862875.1 phage tail protein [Shigella flexneri]EGF7271417.1 phage tail protein [Shigella flexneri]
MTQSAITSAFERLKAQEAAGGNRIIIDQFVFANIPDLNIADTPSENEPLPPDAQIVHRQNVDRNGMVNENTVAYSVTLPESTGDFTFNWLGLVSSTTNTLCMVVYLHPQKKIKTADGKQGNTLIYSEIMEYAGASAATGITTPVSTWQIDFTARLHGMDEATRKAALDIYGPGLFFNNAFKLTAQATGQATFAPGIAYLRGLRVELNEQGTLTYATGISQTVYVDAALTGTLTGENKAIFSLTSQKTADYTDSSGFAHYVEPIATISDSGEITDIRKTRKPLNDRLDGEYLTRNGNLKEIADKGEQAQSDARKHMGLGDSATLNVGTAQDTVAAGDDIRITGALQKNQNGADIPDKPLFIQNVGLQETVNKADNAVQKTGDTLSGGLTFENDSILAWIRNTDWAKIGFKNDSDADTDSYMWFETADNGNEYFKWRHRLAGGRVKDLMNLKWDTLNILVNAVINGCLGIGTTNALGGSSIVLGDNDTGFKQNGDGLLDVYANGQHVFRFQNGVAIAFKNIQAGTARKFTLSSANNSTKNAAFCLWGNPSRPVVAELGDDSGWHFFSQRNTDNSITFAVNGQVIPLNYGNFDARYKHRTEGVQDVRYGHEMYYNPGSNTASWTFRSPSGHGLSGISISDTGRNSADNVNGVYYRPLQKLINGTWYNVASI